MSHKELKEKAIQQMISKAPMSVNKATELLNKMEESLLKEMRIATEYFTTIIPDLETKIQVYESFIGGLQGKFITDKNPEISTLNEIKNNYMKIDLNDYVFNVKPTNESG